VVEPTLENVINGQFPIVRDLIVVTRDNTAPAAVDFINYLKSPTGQKIVEDTGYIALAGQI